jgi:hypothetical protein
MGMVEIKATILELFLARASEPSLFIIPIQKELSEYFNEKYLQKARAFLFVRKRVEGERRKEFYRFLTPTKVL